MFALPAATPVIVNLPLFLATVALELSEDSTEKSLALVVTVTSTGVPIVTVPDSLLNVSVVVTLSFPPELPLTGPIEPLPA